MGNPTTNEEVVRLYLETSAAKDFETLASLRHPDWQTLWPQSGERVVGHAHWAEIAQNYPGGVPEVNIERLVGSEDRWFVTPGNTVARAAGTGDFWWGEWRMRYPDGKTYLCVALLELRDGLIWRETVYWAEPFDPPDWRRQLVEVPNQSTGLT